MPLPITLHKEMHWSESPEKSLIKITAYSENQKTVEFLVVLAFIELLSVRKDIVVWKLT